jgi:peptide/nickel transport system permease protein
MTAPPVPIEIPAPEVARSQVLRALRQSLAFTRTWLGLILVGVLVLVALVGPLLAPYSPTEFIRAPFSPPAAGALFGTDNLGRDVWTRFLFGGRTVLALSLGATALGVVSGVIIGLLAAYFRRWVDEVLMRGMDVLLAFPQIVFVLLLVSTVGPRLWLIVVTVGLTHMPRVARVVRGASLEIVNREYIQAAEAIGEPRRRILFAEILPNITSPLLVELGLRFTYSIGLIASVSFLGFGLQPPAADWGLMINENRVGVSLQPWTVALPVTAIALLTVGTNLVTDGISRALIGVGRRVRRGEGERQRAGGRGSE